MEFRQSLGAGPASLPAGTIVGKWRVVARRGRGTYGVVYRAVPIGPEPGEPVALKLALYPRDPRFAREAELLARMRHPSVPALVDSGWWQPPEGPPFPFLVMQWVEGVTLYEWAEQQRPTSRQAMRLLAQVARALEATHALQGVHRDVKGDNVLVGRKGQAFLTDFGVGSYVGARPLTDTPIPPGTPHYRSPQALRFQWRFQRDLDAHYEYPPADDVYALGVMAYRMVTGIYPPAGTAPQREEYPRCPPPPALLPPGELVTVSEPLGAIILRMLSEEPGARESAAKLAQALEEAARHAGPEADLPLLPRPCMAPTERTSKPGPRSRWARAWERRSTWLAAASAGVLLTWALASQEPASQWPAEAPPPVAQAAEETPDAGVSWDGGTVGLADIVIAAPIASASQPQSRAGLWLDMPRRPFPGQLRPNGDGQCPRQAQVPVNGGCWIELARVKPPCGDEGYEWAGGCYYPVFDSARQPTSDDP
ncbi:serine/threonine-protein kinase [Hyalangium rubrum]|uniref:Serine/threonine-protein kinase n=1 Tax=Hyalangium rubrum TaxID=3103134 RepID=A0ABU5H771_9BACT|nr:serine/threonine-protein kinase [Hyalangium sp. s54d21]MDY7229324.1 serine/threonine-protein kinase [Hyalangium sp. s54d21]